jgi:hypothetical protein
MKNIILATLIILIGVGSAQSQMLDDKFNKKADAFFKENVVDGKVKYASLTNDAALESLVSDIRTMKLNGSSADEKKAFYINAYNLLVIYKVASNYPINSTQEISGFFDKKNSIVCGEKVSLNQLEKEYLLKIYDDPRFHFVLVCGALGCPPITDFAYNADNLEAQMEKQTMLALNDMSFISTDGNNLDISQIFNWYKGDFGKNKSAIVDFINNYRDADHQVDNGSKFNYIDYDWSLNEEGASVSTDGLGIRPGGGNNALRYVVSSTIPKGTIETKIFNNLYTQQTGSLGDIRDRGTFFTTSVTALYGLTNRFNLGISTRYRRVRNDLLPSSPFSVLGGEGDALSTRSGFTAFGPMVRIAPVPKWKNFSIQSSFVFAIGDELEGNGVQPFIDWDGATWNTQFFNDIAIGSNFSLFTEIDFLFEDIGGANRIATPATIIFSYNPLPNMTLYTLGSYARFWPSTSENFRQFGLGFKYQFTPSLEIELLVTDFSNGFIRDVGGQANTFNMGLRFNI